jgi:hypothetical protein
MGTSPHIEKLRKFLVTYTATVYAHNEDEACDNMLEADDFETTAEEVVEEDDL